VNECKYVKVPFKELEDELLELGYSQVRKNGLDSYIKEKSESGNS